MNGLLVEPKDVDGLANALRELLTDKTLYDIVSQNGSQMVKQEFSISQMAKRMDSLYQEVLLEKSHPNLNRP